MRVLTAWAGVSLMIASGMHPRGMAADSPLDSGFRQMYNLEFSEAHTAFRAWKAAHPDDPMGPVSEAAAYLFSEFERLKRMKNDLQSFYQAMRLQPGKQERLDSEIPQLRALNNSILLQTVSSVKIDVCFRNGNWAKAVSKCSRS